MILRLRSFWRLALLLLLCLSFALRGETAYASTSGQTSEPVSVILMLREQARLTTNTIQPAAQIGKNEHRQAVITALKAQASDSQFGALARLEEMQAVGKVSEVKPLWVANAIAVTAPAEAIEELAKLPGVAGVAPDYALHLTDRGSTASISAAANSPAGQLALQTNLSQVGAQTMWQNGYTGKGVVVANVDSGVSLSNSDLAAKWRGGSNSWFDTHHEHATPADFDGHGTATMGIMVSSTYGVAPGAQWIAVKMFSDAGYATIADALAAFQWLLDPDGNPQTADAPDVVNNSWSESSSGCVNNPALHTALQSLVAAGILPVFSAGNLGPLSSSDPYPSNYPEVLAVGAVNSSNMIQDFSSRGPSACRPDGQVFPDIVAPGYQITSTGINDGSTTTMSGTSFSAPHVAGALALLLNAYPNLSADEQRTMLRAGATTVSGSRPNNTYGYGLLNVNFAYKMAFIRQDNPSRNVYFMPMVNQ